MAKAPKPPVDGPRLLECRGIEIATLTTPKTASEAARYLLCRVRESWPEAFIEDKTGEQYTHHSYSLPPVFSIVENNDEVPVGKQRARPLTSVIGVTISGRMIQLSFSEANFPDALAVAEILAADPIWGPTWTQTITRYMA